MKNICRFAPSTTGPAHPGTLLAGLLAWLDARTHGAHFILRLENIDPARCRPQWQERMTNDLAWLGLDWDELDIQSTHADHHNAAVNALAAQGKVYVCTCTRSQIRQRAKRSPDGGWAYPNTCRENRVTPDTWQQADGALRVHLPDATLLLEDESGLDLSQNPQRDHGDPVIRRRDGAFAYHLAVVVDDAASGVNRIVRGRDLAMSTATHAAIQDCLGLLRPQYRHHGLLLEQRGSKMAKLHGSVSAEVLRQHYSAPELVGLLAHSVGLHPNPAPISPTELLTSFSWHNVIDDDRLIEWESPVLSIGERVPAVTLVPTDTDR